MAIDAFRGVALGLGAIACSAISVPAIAQDSEARLRKIEAEVRALQRQVFTGTGERSFQPEITGSQTTGSGSAGTSTSTALTDVLARLDSLESQISQLTAVSEENRNAISQLQMQMASIDGSSGSTTVASAGPEGSSSSIDLTSSATTQPAASRSIPTSSGPSSERLARVQAITKPQSGDEGDDEYSYGFRLWNAGLYPEAQQQLQSFVDSYPSHWRTTFGRNLLGRAYLDDGKPREAASWFLKNYQTDKNAARAGDSLLYLAESMIEIEDTRRACIALAEFGDTYPALATGRLQSKYEANTAKVSCN